MKLIAPDYYSGFACLMGECRHTCCAGWEIDIDEDTMELYRSVPGETGERLRSCIDESGEAPCFRLTEDERCPFLNDHGLCELIISGGENMLCQICADHPRFRNFFSDRTEVGLGLCCEAAARLILTRSEPFRLVLLENDGGSETPDARETELFALRAQLLSLLQDRSVPVEKRVRRMLAEAGLYMGPVPFADWAAFLITLEQLDSAWGDRLRALHAMPEPDLSPLCAPEWELAFEQLMAYLLFRHMPGILEDGEAAPRIAFAALIWRLLRALCGVHAAQNGSVSVDDLIELARLYSSEIEYSDENTAAILDRLGGAML